MMKKLGLYVHIPFCKAKCGYCDFVSYAGKEALMPAYVDAVLEEAALYAQDASSYSINEVLVDTVFFGGGTPSHLPAGELVRLLEGLSKCFDIAPYAEITMEANPDSFTDAQANQYAAAGINRVSFGLQASQAHLLRTIGRMHSYADFVGAVRAARGAGITNISGDLIYGLPGQTVGDVQESAQALVELGLNHVSAYSLKLEEGVPMYGTPPVCDALDRELFYAIYDVLAGAGYERYEISNFAKPRYESRHNLKYWRVEEYIGLGAGAHSFYHTWRYGNDGDIHKYIEYVNKGRKPALFKEPEDPLVEMVLLKTRLKEGMPLEDISFAKNGMELVHQMERQGLCTVKGGTLILTDAGMDIHNTIVARLLDFIETD